MLLNAWALPAALATLTDDMLDLVHRYLRDSDAEREADRRGRT